MNLDKSSKVLIEGFKSILTAIPDFATVMFTNSEQEIFKSSFPLCVFHWGQYNFDDLALKPETDRKADGTFKINNNVQLHSSIEIYGEEASTPADIGQALMLGRSSENFQQVIYDKAKLEQIPSPAIMTFDALKQAESFQADQKFLHRADLHFTWNYIASLKTVVPCFQRTPVDTFPKIQVNKKQ